MNCLTSVKGQFLQPESKQTFPENLKFKKRDYNFQMEVVEYSLKTKNNLLPIKLDQSNDLKVAILGEVWQNVPTSELYLAKNWQFFIKALDKSGTKKGYFGTLN